MANRLNSLILSYLYRCLLQMLYIGVVGDTAFSMDHLYSSLSNGLYLVYTYALGTQMWSVR
jgi:hypothetical protein